MNILVLPPEVIGLIESYLTIEEISRFSRTCHHIFNASWTWQKKLKIGHKNIDSQVCEWIVKRCERLESLSLQHIYTFKNEHLSILSKIFLKSLVLSFCSHIDDEGLSIISKMESLKRLEISFNGKITSKGISYLTNLKLEKLVLRGCHKLDTLSIDYITQIPTLRHIIISQCNIISSSIKQLVLLSQLVKLELSSLNLKDEDLKILLQLKDLKILKLNDNIISNKTLRYISENNNIEILDLSSNSEINGESFYNLETFFNLREINLHRCGSINGKDLLNFINATRLESLDIGYCKLLSPLPSEFSCFRHLRNLNLMSCNITDESLKVIGKNTSLVNLNLCGNYKIRNSGIKFLSSLTNLKSLDLSLLGISEKGISYLYSLTKLENLWLNWCGRISDEVGPLLSLFKLRKLSLRSCKGITENIIPFLLSHETLKSLDVSYTNIAKSQKLMKKFELEN